MHFTNKKKEKHKFRIVHNKQVKHSTEQGLPKNRTNVRNTEKIFNLSITVDLVQPIVKIQILNIEQEEETTAGASDSVLGGRKSQFRPQYDEVFNPHW